MAYWIPCVSFCLMLFVPCFVGLASTLRKEMNPPAPAAEAPPTARQPLSATTHTRVVRAQIPPLDRASLTAQRNRERYLREVRREPQPSAIDGRLQVLCQR